MKYTWEKIDVQAGRRVSGPNRAEQSIVGYDPAIDSSGHWAVISLRDGQITTSGLSRQGMADYLNKGGWRPDDIKADIEKADQ